MGATSGAGTPYPSKAPDINPCFRGDYVAQSLVFCVVFCTSFVLVLLSIVLSIILRFTDSDYSFGIFKLFSLSSMISNWCLRTLLFPLCVLTDYGGSE